MRRVLVSALLFVGMVLLFHAALTVGEARQLGERGVPVLIDGEEQLVDPYLPGLVAPSAAAHAERALVPAGTGIVLLSIGAIVATASRPQPRHGITRARAYLPATIR